MPVLAHNFCLLFSVIVSQVLQELNFTRTSQHEMEGTCVTHTVVDGGKTDIVSSIELLSHPWNNLSPQLWMFP